MGDGSGSHLPSYESCLQSCPQVIPVMGLEQVLPKSQHSDNPDQMVAQHHCPLGQTHRCFSHLLFPVICAVVNK